MYGSPQFSPPAGWTPPPKPRSFGSGVTVGVIATLVVVAAVAIVLAAAAPLGSLVASPGPVGASNAVGTAAPVADTPAPSTAAGCASEVVACGSLQGVTVDVLSVQRTFQPKVTAGLEPDASPRHGFHWLRLVVTIAVSGAPQDIEPFGVEVRDPIGQDTPDISASLLGDKRCNTPSGGIYGNGESLGPIPLCYQVAGQATDSLALIWFPTLLTGPQSVLTLDLP